MLKKQLIISGLTTSSVVGGGITVALLNAVKTKEITLKDQLENLNYEAVPSGKFGIRRELLKEYYGDFESKIKPLGLGDWCQAQGKISDKDKISPHFKDFCFESIGSKIEDDGKIAILKTGEEADFYASAWADSFKSYQTNYKEGSDLLKSSDWDKSDSLENFQKQCKKNGKKIFTKDMNTLMQQVKTYCTKERKFN